MKKALVLAVALALTGCGGAEPAEETDTRVELILEESWATQGAERQGIMCWGWEQDREMMLSSFFGELDDSIPLTREQAIEFFDEKCP